jgi:hypothetical protein
MNLLSSNVSAADQDVTTKHLPRRNGPTTSGCKTMHVVRHGLSATHRPLGAVLSFPLFVLLTLLPAPSQISSPGGSMTAFAQEAAASGTRQPDMMIRSISPKSEPTSSFIRDGAPYNTDAVGQTKSQTVVVGKTAKYAIRLQNDGNTADKFKITGGKGGSGWTVKYWSALSGGTDITSAVTGTNGWTTPNNVAAGGSIQLRVDIKPTSSAKTNVKEVTVLATSVADTTKKDAVKTVTFKSGTARVTSASLVTLSTASAQASTDLIHLKFMRALDAATASDAAHYEADVNGSPIVVESVSYRSSTLTVTLALPEGTLQAGDKVTVSWSDLLDAEGNAVEGEIGPITAR